MCLVLHARIDFVSIVHKLAQFRITSLLREKRGMRVNTPVYYLGGRVLAVRGQGVLAWAEQRFRLVLEFYRLNLVFDVKVHAGAYATVVVLVLIDFVARDAVVVGRELLFCCNPNHLHLVSMLQILLIIRHQLAFLYAAIALGGFLLIGGRNG